MTEVIGIDHIYLAVTDLARAEAFYDQVAVAVLEFRKMRFELAGAPHIQYYNRHFGLVLRPATGQPGPSGSGPGLHHLCLRVESPEDVAWVALELQRRGIDASAAALRPEYAPDYWATYFSDPDGIRLEVTNYRQERRDRHNFW